jgi:hexosaminidase
MNLNLIPYPRCVTVTRGFAPDTVTKQVDSALTAEAYRLEANSTGIHLTAGSSQGLIWAEHTLRQLRRQFPEAIPCLTIEDEPAYAFRSFHLDSARHFFPMSEMKKIADMAARFKLNTLHWHFSDDQGWRIESNVFPKLHQMGAYRNGDHFGTYCSNEREGGYYTQEEVRDFVAYCADLGVQVIPELDLPGHVSAILHAYPQLSCRGEQVEVVTRAAITTEILCAGKEEVYVFLEKLLEELLELFPAPWFHIGGDEAPKTRWAECPHCQALMQRLGLQSHRQLQGYMSNRIAAFLKERGRRTILWNDGAYGGGIDPDVVLQVWYPDRDGALDNHIAGGGQIILSLVDPCYCDYPYGMTPLIKTYNYNPVHKGVKKPENIIGVEATIWTEYINNFDKLCYMCFPRFTAVAETGWTLPENRNHSDFIRRFIAYTETLDKFGIKPASPEEWNPSLFCRLSKSLSFANSIRHRA